MTGLGALVADLAGLAERTTVGSSAVPRDVAELATGIALHGLSLAVTGEVVRATAFVASSSTGVAAKATTEALIAAARSRRPPGTGGGRVGAIALWVSINTITDIQSLRLRTHSKVPGLAAVVAAAIGTV